YNHQITLVNNVGIIDEDYRGNIGIKLINNGDKDYQIEKGDRVAQMIIVPYIQPQLEFVDKLSKTERGTGGFGSTGR
ncbi:MAG TPA: dUTP diphosphatase, partial [Tissierellaceae bacterium]|nr:dUTP diphosphatase [Tissierellaceae bacterium]